MTDIENGVMTQDQVTAIIDALRNAGRSLPAQAIQAARQNKERLIPELIQAIEEATQALQRKQEPNGNAAFFALFLLAEFRASAGLPAILEAISLPGDGPYRLFGDAIHEVLPRVLVVLGNDRCVEICAALFRNRTLDEFVRWSAAKAIVYLAMAGLRPRADIVSICGQLFSEAVAHGDSEGCTGMICAMVDLNPWESAKKIEEAFQRDLVDEGVIDWDSVADHLHDKPLQPSRDYPDPVFFEDTIAELQKWAAFQEPKPVPPPPSVAPSFPQNTPPVPLVARPSPVRPRVGRNDPCPCGSGKKFKRCCSGRST